MLLQMILLISLILTCGGAIYTFIINRNTMVPMNGDFWDMPLKIKSGIISILLGIIVFIIWTFLYIFFVFLQ